MKATLIIQGDVMQVNLQASNEDEKRVLAAIRDRKAKLITVGASNIDISECQGGTLRSYDRSPGFYSRTEPEPEALALVFASAHPPASRGE